MMALLRLSGMLCIAAATQTRTVHAQTTDVAGIAGAARNPIAAVVNLPLELSAGFNSGASGRALYATNFQPVIPITLSDQWNLITRTSLTLAWQPAMGTGESGTFGLGAVQVGAVLSPALAQNGNVWGVGAVVQVPTATDEALGSRLWGVGPAVVALTTPDPFMLGFLVTNLWSLGSNPESRYNVMSLQLLASYDLPERPGAYVSFAPTITADWEAPGGQRWTVPLGLSIGQAFEFGRQAFNLEVGAYYNAIRPETAAEWQVRLQLSLLFPH
jgi:hypothetical protein